MKIPFIIGMALLGTLQCSLPRDSSCLQIGGNYAYATIKMKEHHRFHGNLGGLQASYEYRPQNHLYLGARVAWKQGTTENSSALRHFAYVDAQERIGYSCTAFCERWILTFYTGLGYRYISQNLKQFSERAVKFEYNEFYVPVGFLSEYYFNPCLSLGLNFTWMPQVYPTVKISPLKGARWILKSTLNNVLVELPITYFLPCDNRYFVVLKPFYEHWEDGKSTAKTSSGEKLNLPKNLYNFWGVELNFGLTF